MKSIKDIYKDNPELMLSLPRTRKAATAGGVPHYYTGMKCIHGHVCPREVKSGNCMDCITFNSAGTRAKKFMKENPGAVSANKRRLADDLRAQIEIERLEKKRFA